MKPLSVYIHVPFCAKKCDYCDFASWAGRSGDWRRYFETLWGEMERWQSRLAGYEARTLFIGGGTPTLVDAGYIKETLGALRRIMPFAADAEITIEGNPGTLTFGKLKGYRDAGINRISLGAQSFDEGLLRSLGRIHTVPQIAGAVRMCRDAGLDNINLDLMYALPGQRMDDWKRTLDAAIDLSPAHISAYSLIVEPGTPIDARVRAHTAVLPEDETVNNMQRLAVSRLAQAGYARYEISNYARPGRACRHNLVYWLRGDYLGLGCAAHSMFEGARFSNPEALEEYLVLQADAGKDPPPGDLQRLTREDDMEETLMLSTRLTRGLDMAAWERDFGEPFSQGREGVLEMLGREGLIELSEGFMRLTIRGMEVHNAVVLALSGDV